MNRARQPELGLLHPWQWFYQMFGKPSLQEKGHLTVQFCWRLGMLHVNGNSPPFRLKSLKYVAQKRLCLSSPIADRRSER